MSRGTRDLREIICVSRLCSTYQNEDIPDIPDQYLNDYVADFKQKQSVDKLTISKPYDKSGNRPSSNNHHIKCSIPNIKNGFINDNFQDSMKYLDMINEQLLSEWLCKANKQLHNLIEWAQDNNKFVNFTNFWLVELPSTQRRELFAMEYNILQEQIKIGLIKFIHNDNITDKLTNQLLITAFWEYPIHFVTSSTGYYLFIEYLDSLVSVGCDNYKTILTNVKISTQNKQLIQILLSIRALALLSIWSSIVDFFRNLIERGDIQLKSTEIHLPNHSDSMYARLCIAICHEFIPTLQYWIQKKKIDFQEYRDAQNRTLLILAVSYNSISVVQYFVKNFDVSSIINSSTKTGNSALHIAVCQGSTELVKLIIEDGHADVNIVNEDCDDCTPLHMAAMYGQEEIARILMHHGANLELKTHSNSTAMDMAKIYEQQEMVKLLNEFQGVTLSSDSNISKISLS